MKLIAEADIYTHAALLPTDYIEIQQMDPDEPGKVTGTELKELRATRRSKRQAYRDLVITLNSCSSIEAMDSAYEVFLGKF